MDEVQSKRNPGWTWVDNRVLQDTRLNAYDKTTYFCLCKFADSDNKCFPAMPKLEKMVGASKPTIAKSIKKLQELNYITVERRHYGAVALSNLYTINDISEVVPLEETEEPEVGNDTTHVGKQITHPGNDVYCNNKQLTKNNEQTYYNTQTTLIPVPKSETVIDGKIPYALATGNWSGITNTDLLEYFVLIHNRNMPEKVALPNGKAKSYLVGLFRDCFIDKYNLSPQDTVYLIPSLIDVYKTHPVVSEKYRNKFEPSAFAQNWLINALMETLQSKKKYSRVKLDVSDKDTPEVF